MDLPAFDGLWRLAPYTIGFDTRSIRNSWIILLLIGYVLYLLMLNKSHHVAIDQCLLESRIIIPATYEKVCTELYKIARLHSHDVYSCSNPFGCKSSFPSADEREYHENFPGP